MEVFHLRVLFSIAEEGETEGRGHQKLKICLVHHGFAAASSILLLPLLTSFILILTVSII
jgi:hypothetical protein